MTHQHGAPRYDRAFAIGVALNLIFVILEAAFGVISHSLALLADSGHNLSDVAGLLLAWGASVLARRAPTARRTYGWRGSSILAALFNAVLLLIAVGAIAWEAIRRFERPMPVASGTVIWVAAVGIAINGATAMLFFAGRKRDLNIRGAFLHMAADTAVSVGVVIAGVVIARTGWSWVDPVTSLAIVTVITVGTWSLLRESVNLALHAVPEGIDPQTVHDYLAGMPGVAAVHDLHIWPMSTTEVALTGHIVKPELANDDALLTRISQDLHDRFGIEHATLQVERDASHFCSLSSDIPPNPTSASG
jgi:cobalt-zinc-cadmium efflux system protein